MEFIVKTFQELSTEELYDILGLRSEVFVVEQNCVYQDIDYKDAKALHVLGYQEGVLIAYTRIFKEGDYFKNASIGRVVVKESARKDALGSRLMRATIEATKHHFNPKNIEISAQHYLLTFYQKLGFKEFGEVYLEDDIPHIRMLLILS